MGMNSHARRAVVAAAGSGSWQEPSSQARAEEAAVEEEEEELDPAALHNDMRVEHTTGTVDLETLLNRAEKKRINLKPRYQRGYIWGKQKAYRLIESVMGGLFVPAVVTHAKVEDFVDGKQRLTTLLAFRKGVFPDGSEFRLQDLTKLTELNGKSYCDLPEDRLSPTSPSRYDFDSRMLPCTKLLPSTTEEAVLRVYEDLNAGAEQLNKQQIRRAVFGGPYIDLLESLAQHETFLAIRAAKHAAKDESDQELILRFFALRRRTRTVVGFKGAMHTCLNNEISQHRQLDAQGEMEQEAELRSLFSCTINLVWTIYGDKAFRRWTSKGFEKDINTSILRSCHADLRRAQVHVAADALRDDVEGLCKTAEFLNNRFSAERLEARLRVYKERLIAVVAAAVEERKAMKARTVRVFPKGLRKKLYTQGQQSL
ncbi:hypothetical protein CHLNCDRAFT_145316 [Chlorella variabilis]|uniref:GmrSD restriction endonucleases N-terminal domain-containing protein n=1 Tax=Chlorella variabilis TaxID=554065 RepID=E1ZE59_CHLVA|nr:hypothetical protein CHLNCDRAFT_145316 [Chlorella variabilis]EFN55812.1 hypothetical protein CHLNCDRAFT_145316 [Chlorella variabilis]|eukprot:XP_005847914.1 hypothetical protein CHLNCDRAFT_145316 [Chlorella variabilis]